MSDQETQEIYNECFRAFVANWKQHEPCKPMTKAEIQRGVADIFHKVLDDATLRTKEKKFGLKAFNHHRRSKRH